MPKIAIILGSGLGEFAENIKDSITIKYQDIPHFHIPTIPGHAGKLILGKLMGKDIAVMQGRYSYPHNYCYLNNYTIFAKDIQFKMYHFLFAF